MVNGGLQVVNPSTAVYDVIVEQLKKTSGVDDYEFADQSLLSDLFKGRWVPLPYVYNALKTLRWKGVHDVMWKDDEVKNIHYILAPKPWAEKPLEATDETHAWWFKANEQRLADERSNGIDDGI